MSPKPLIPALLALAAALPMPAAWADPPDWAPAHGYRAKHRYVYYPAQEIYYEPATSLWFWLDGGDWRFGAGLPIYYQQYTRGGVTIELDAERPYYRHDYVVEHYGRGPRVVEEHYYHDRPREVIVEHHYDRPREVIVEHRYEDRHHGKHKHHKHGDRDD